MPFAGAASTGAFAINNSGEIVGDWSDATTNHGFLLSGGTYTSIDYPGAAAPNGSATEGINNNGEIVGVYTDATGVEHGFLLSGGTYNSLDPPGSTDTQAYGINDAGAIVGAYCLTSECAANADSFQAFLLTGGSYTAITIPGATESGAAGINNNGVILGDYYRLRRQPRLYRDS